MEIPLRNVLGFYRALKLIKYSTIEDFAVSELLRGPNQQNITKGKLVIDKLLPKMGEVTLECLVLSIY